MHQIEITYKNNLRTKCKYIQTGNIITTDAPVDNHGKGETFSPTDLIASALGSCILTIMGIAAERCGIDIKGTSAEVIKFMEKDPRRISKIIIHIYFPIALSNKHLTILERSAHSCPVHHSLNADIEKVIIFHHPSSSDKT